MPRRGLAALAFVLAVHPQHLAGRGVERHDGAARAGGRVEDAVDHQRRGLEVELRPRTERVGLEAPGHLQLVEVVAVDLVERPVAAAGEIAAVGRPFAVSLARLSEDAVVHRRQQGDEREHRDGKRTESAQHGRSSAVGRAMRRAVGLYACVRRGRVELAATFGGAAQRGAPVLTGAPIERQQAIPLSDEFLFDRQLTA